MQAAALLRALCAASIIAAKANAADAAAARLIMASTRAHTVSLFAHVSKMKRGVVYLGLSVNVREGF